MGPERISAQTPKDRLSRETQGLSREFVEVLKPSQEIIHQTGLELVNTRLLMNQLSRIHQTPITIDMVSTTEWSNLFKNHDIIWFMGIYKPSEWSRQHALGYADKYRPALFDLDPERDVVASPFAIPEYKPNPSIAPDWDSWDSMVDRLHGINKKVIIDFVPNHVAVDHPWQSEHPEYFIQGTHDQFQANPSLYQEVHLENGDIHYLAHGKDPNFPEWVDTLQLNWANPQVQEEMENELIETSKHADGVRCDMAMLLNPDTFIRTWGNHLSENEISYIKKNNFWEKAIPKVKDVTKQEGRGDFMFVAEAYWDKEELGQHFDYIYGKDFYDHLKRIVNGNDTPAQNLKAHVSYLMDAVKNGRHYKDVLFTENHDEERAVREFGKEPSKAVAALTGLIPEAIFLINQGQEEGRRIRPPMQIGRFPDEAPDENMKMFYERLLALKRSKLFQEGDYKLADINDGNDNIVALQVAIKPNTSSFIPKQELGAIACINIGHTTATGRLSEIGQDKTALVYRLSEGDFVRNSDMKRLGGMYIELIPWETQVIFYKNETP